MAGINLKNGVTNQFGAPSINENTFANRPSAGQPGRIFIATDTGLMYRDTGSTWTTLSPSTPGGTPGGSNDSFLGSSVQWNNGSGTFGGDSYFLYRDSSVDFKVPKGTFGQIGSEQYGPNPTMTNATLNTGAGLGTNTDMRGCFNLNAILNVGSTSATITLNYGSLTGFYVNTFNSQIIILPNQNFSSSNTFTYNITSSSSSGISFQIINTGTLSIGTFYKFGYVVIL